MFHLADRLRNPETLFLATLIAIQERSGGPLIEALTSLSQILRDRERLQQKRMVASAEARMSALILGGLPVLVASLLFTSNPTYRETLLNSQSGRGFLLLAGILLITGSVVMYRMIRIDPR
jgi:tight adherence protein B